jgi:hypothetical protein
MRLSCLPTLSAKDLVDRRGQAYRREVNRGRSTVLSFDPQIPELLIKDKA